ncbi:MAG: peptidylprolyl isomerase [Pseudomonadota bacterium]
MKRTVAALASFGLAGSALTGSVLADALEGKPSGAEILQNAGADAWRALDQEDLLYIELDRGLVIIELSPSLARAHGAQMRALAREGFYDGLSFYRVIEGFVAQGGDLLETREINAAAESLADEFDEPMRDEMIFTPLKDTDGYAAAVGFVDSHPVGVDGARERIWKLHCTGAVAMARGNEKDTGGTEFYVALQPQRYLDRNLSVFGRVVQGMEHLQALRRVAPALSEEDDLGETILTMRVGADLPEQEQVALEVLRSDTDVFNAYVEARRNRPEAFFYYRPDHIDICQFPIPIREARAGEGE